MFFAVSMEVATDIEWKYHYFLFSFQFVIAIHNCSHVFPFLENIFLLITFCQCHLYKGYPFSTKPCAYECLFKKKKLILRINLAKRCIDLKREKSCFFLLDMEYFILFYGLNSYNLWSFELWFSFFLIIFILKNWIRNVSEQSSSVNWYTSIVKIITSKSYTKKRAKKMKEIKLVSIS